MRSETSLGTRKGMCKVYHRERGNIMEKLRDRAMGDKEVSSEAGELQAVISLYPNHTQSPL